MLSVATLPTGKWKENCYVVSSGSSAVVIDPGEEAGLILEHLRDRNLSVDAILNTHAHYDHVGAVSDLKRAYGAKFHLHRGDFKLLTQANFFRMLFEGQRTIEIPSVDTDLAGVSQLTFGDIVVAVIRTPGHTQGGVSFLIDAMLFTGDNIIGRKLGRTDLPGGNKEQLAASVETLLSLDPAITIHPGHGRPATIGELRQSMMQKALAS